MIKRWSIIIGAALIGARLVICMGRDLFEAIPYFSSQPHRLLYVGGIAIAGGFVALGIDRLSPWVTGVIVYFAGHPHPPATPFGVPELCAQKLKCTPPDLRLISTVAASRARPPDAARR